MFDIKCVPISQSISRINSVVSSGSF